MEFQFQTLELTRCESCSHQDMNLCLCELLLNFKDNVKYNIMCFRYMPNMLVKYNVQCNENELAFYNITFLDTQGSEDCQHNGYYWCSVHYSGHVTVKSHFLPAGARTI